MIAILIVMINIVKAQTIDSLTIDSVKATVEMGVSPIGEIVDTIPISMNVISIVLFMLGWLIHIGVKFNKRTDKTSQFNIKKYWEENWIREAIGLLCAIAVVLMYYQAISIVNTLKPDALAKVPAKLIMVLVYGHPVIMFMIGWFNHSIISVLVKKVSSKVPIEEED